MTTTVPTTTIPTTAAGPTAVSGTRNLSGVFRWVRIFFYGTVLGELILLIGTVLMMGQDGYDPVGALTLGETVASIGGVVFLLTFLPSIVVFCVFTYRALKNLHLLGVKDAEMKPVWAVGSYFIPIANLFIPYRGMDQIVDGTTRLSGTDVDPSHRLPVWWGGWIITNIASNISFRMGGGLNGTYGPGMFEASLWLDVLSGVAGIAATFIIVPILGRISAAQDARLTSGVFD